MPLSVIAFLTKQPRQRQDEEEKEANGWCLLASDKHKLNGTDIWSLQVILKTKTVIVTYLH